MTKRDKREERIRKNPKAVAFDELDWLLRQYGFSEVRRNGSHASYRHPDLPQGILTVPFHRPSVGSHYVKQVLAMIDSVTSED